MVTIFALKTIFNLLWVVILIGVLNNFSEARPLWSGFLFWVEKLFIVFLLRVIRLLGKIFFRNQREEPVVINVLIEAFRYHLRYLVIAEELGDKL